MGEEEKSIFQVIRTVCRISVIQGLDQINVLRERERLGNYPRGAEALRQRISVMVRWMDECRIVVDPFLWH